ncbi:hypothetical protein LD669_18090 [Salmonella enterica]|nr:hypothetical protein [Salmonella enterica]MDJ7090074.1 hypothetical protein [Salmonella enterica]
MDFRLKKHRKQYFIVISYAASRNYCVPAPHVHGQEIFKTLFHFPNHELHHVKKQLKQQVAEDDEIIKLSENATKIMNKIINEDVTDFYENAMIDVMDISKISVNAALDELSEHGLIEAYSARPGYGLHYHLTRKAKKQFLNS